MKKEMAVAKVGFLQALLVVSYCTLVGLFMWNAEKIFGKMDTFFGPVAFLTLFSASALICAIIVFSKPYRLFFDGKKKEALDIVIFTSAFLFLFFILILGTILLGRNQ